MIRWLFAIFAALLPVLWFVLEGHRTRYTMIAVGLVGCLMFALPALTGWPGGVGPDGDLYVTKHHVVARLRFLDSNLATATRVAGGYHVGQGGVTTEGAQARDSYLQYAYNIAVSRDGTVYISEDTPFDRVRAVMQDGSLRTVAGGNGPGFSGDGGPARGAQLNRPGSLAFGPDGSLYIADEENHRIRRIGWDGIIHTVAGTGQANAYSGDGGQAKNAAVDPSDIVVTDDGALFVLQGSRVVRRIDQNGIITRIAGRPDLAGPSAYGANALNSSAEGLSLALTPDGDVLLNQWSAVAKVRAPGPGTDIGELTIGSPDGSETFVFSSDGRHLRTQHGLTGAVLRQFTYESDGSLAAIDEGEGNVTTVERDFDGVPTGIVGPFGQRTELELDDNGFLSRIVAPEGDDSEFQYSNTGLMQSMTDPRGHQYEFDYDELGRLIRDSAPNGGYKTLNVDEPENSRTVTVQTAGGIQKDYTANLTANGESESAVTRSGLTTTTVRTADGTMHTVNPDGTTVDTKYGPHPRLGLEVQVPTSVTTTTSLGRVDHTTRETLLIGTSGFIERTTRNGAQTVLSYNDQTRTYTKTTPAGRRTTVTTDERGRIVSIRAGNLEPLEFEYDEHGRLVATLHGARVSSYEFGNFGVDAGFPTRITDAAGGTVEIARDSFGRPRTLTFEESQAVATWDPNGNLTSVAPPSRPSHAMTYSPVDLLLEYSPPILTSLSEPQTAYEYEVDGRLTMVTRPDGSVLDYAYDSVGRLATITTPDGVVNHAYFAPAPCAGCSPGELRQVTSTDGVSVEVTREDRVTTSTTWSGPVAGSVSWAFDNNFRAIQETVSNNSTTSSQFFGYDADGFLICASSSSTCNPADANALFVTYDPDSGLLTDLNLGGVSETFTYNTFGELFSQAASFGSVELFSETYDTATNPRDALGRIARKIETLEDVTTIYDYVYDARGRLETVTEDGTLVETYSYDENGNRTSLTMPGGGTIAATYDDQDRLTTYGESAFTYTANGELRTLTDTTTGDLTEYYYDAFGNLKRVNLSNGDVIEYLVDGHNRRVGKKKNGVLVQQWMYRNQLNPIAEFDGAGNLVARFVYGSRENTPDYLIRGGVTYRVIADHLGSPRLVLNVSNGVVVKRMRHSAFGTVLEDTGPELMPFGFAGGMHDTETGLTMFGARQYDAARGRWVSKDPSRFRGGMNLYEYSRSNPINYRDPNGRNPIVVLGALAAASIVATALGVDAYGEFLALRSQRRANAQYPDRKSGENNYLRHCVASCLATKELGDFSGPLMDGREYIEQFFGASKSHCDVDRYNNGVGRQAAESVFAQPGETELEQECEDRCFSLFWIGKTTARDRG